MTQEEFMKVVCHNIIKHLPLYSSNTFSSMQANLSVFNNIAGRTYTSRITEVLNELFTECDVGQDGILLFDESIACWELVETGEYMLYKMLRDSIAALDVYGTCGNMYVVQFADAEAYMGYKTSGSETKPWSLRARLAVAILELVESIEQTPYGTLYLCDVQGANFGVVSRIHPFIFLHHACKILNPD